MNYICRVLDYMAWFWFMEWLILVYIINRIIHGRLEIWNLSSRVHVRYRCEHSKINSISPRDHVLFSIYETILLRRLQYPVLENEWENGERTRSRPLFSPFLVFRLLTVSVTGQANTKRPLHIAYNKGRGVDKQGVQWEMYK